jgi:hypothetical protein
MKVKVGDIIEVRAQDGFAKITAVMLHRNTVFFVVSWLVCMADKHPLLQLAQYRCVPIFSKNRPTFLPLEQARHLGLVSGTYFVEVKGGILLKNDWVFNVV